MFIPLGFLNVQYNSEPIKMVIHSKIIQTNVCVHVCILLSVLISICLIRVHKCKYKIRAIFSQLIRLSTFSCT